MFYTLFSLIYYVKHDLNVVLQLQQEKLSIIPTRSDENRSDAPYWTFSPQTNFSFSVSTQPVNTRDVMNQ